MDLTQATDNRVIVLCRKLLSLLTAESAEISISNIDNLERYGSQKQAVVAEMQGLQGSGLWTSSPEDAAEIRSLMEKIVELNSSNEKRLLNIRQDILNRFATLQTTKTAHEAYSAK